MKRLTLILIFIITSLTCNGQTLNEYLKNTYYGKSNNITGTYFKISDFEIYITAKHLINSETGFCQIKFLIKNKWENKHLKVFKHPYLDIAIIWNEKVEIKEVIKSVSFKKNNIKYGTEVILLGYPGDSKIYFMVEKLPNGQPQAFLKEGKFCGTFGINKKKYLANSILSKEGFSGGPILVKTKKGNYSLLGINKGNLKMSSVDIRNTGISLFSEVYGIDKLLKNELKK